MKTGLASVTFRKLKPIQIINLVSKAALDCIEWGADIHVPNIMVAKEVKLMCNDYGILPYSYGSYYRCGSEEDINFKNILEIASELSCKTVRIWAGNLSSKLISEYKRSKIIEDTIKVSEIAEDYNIKLAFEFHNNTLTDYVDSAINLIKQVNKNNVRLYWQPLDMHSEKDNLYNLSTILPFIENIHVFGNQLANIPMLKNIDFWNNCKKILDTSKLDFNDKVAYLEFVLNSSEKQFFDDAICLKKVFSGIK